MGLSRPKGPSLVPTWHHGLAGCPLSNPATAFAHEIHFHFGSDSYNINRLEMC
jgi:hypothetical protein